jgi:hypothetical protein
VGLGERWELDSNLHQVKMASTWQLEAVKSWWRVFKVSAMKIGLYLSGREMSNGGGAIF